MFRLGSFLLLFSSLVFGSGGGYISSGSGGGGLVTQGTIPWLVAPSGTPKTANGKVTGSLSEVTVATIPLTVLFKYSQISALFSCRRSAAFSVVWNDNGVFTTLLEAVLDAGQYSFSSQIPNLSVTAGAVGVQQLLVKGYNFDKASDLRASITALEN